MYDFEFHLDVIFCFVSRTPVSFRSCISLYGRCIVWTANPNQFTGTCSTRRKSTVVHSSFDRSVIKFGNILFVSTVTPGCMLCRQFNNQRSNGRLLACLCSVSSYVNTELSISNFLCPDGSLGLKVECECEFHCHFP